MINYILCFCLFDVCVWVVAGHGDLWKCSSSSCNHPEWSITHLCSYSFMANGGTVKGIQITPTNQECQFTSLPLSRSGSWFENKYIYIYMHGDGWTFLMGELARGGSSKFEDLGIHDPFLPSHNSSIEALSLSFWPTTSEDPPKASGGRMLQEISSHSWTLLSP